MIGNFSKALAVILKFEGGFSDNPHDPGRATNFGITQKTYDIWQTSIRRPRRSVRFIRLAEVRQIYKKLYWDAVHGDALPSGIDYAVFDYAVNSGPKQALKSLQANPTIDGLCNERLAFLRSLRIWPYFHHDWSIRVASVRALSKAAAKPAPMVRASPSPLQRRVLPQPGKPVLVPTKPPKTGLPARLEALLQPVSAAISHLFGAVHMPNGTTNMLNGHKTNLVSVIALGLLGGIGMTSGWQGIINQAPAIIAILLPVIAMTLHHAIKHYGLENQATAITEILAGIHDLNLGPISQVAGDADEVLEEALAPDTPAASVDDARPKVKK